MARLSKTWQPSGSRIGRGIGGEGKGVGKTSAEPGHDCVTRKRSSCSRPESGADIATVPSYDAIRVYSIRCTMARIWVVVSVLPLARPPRGLQPRFRLQPCLENRCDIHWAAAKLSKPRSSLLASSTGFDGPTFFDPSIPCGLIYLIAEITTAPGHTIPKSITVG